ncbi:MAG TPA: hypothetical protein VFL54_03815 [Gammaproteobacteria bacterium]|nr:hypothetical protein [Gammaproteobacteria bacterium]
MAEIREGDRVICKDRHGNHRATGRVIGRKTNNGWWQVRITHRYPPFIVNYPPEQLELEVRR